MPVPSVTITATRASAGRAEPVLGPGRGVGVVLDHHRHPDAPRPARRAAARCARPGAARTARWPGRWRSSRPRRCRPRRPRGAPASSCTTSAITASVSRDVVARASRAGACRCTVPSSSTTPAGTLVPPMSTPIASGISSARPACRGVVVTGRCGCTRRRGAGSASCRPDRRTPGAHRPAPAAARSARSAPRPAVRASSRTLAAQGRDRAGTAGTSSTPGCTGRDPGGRRVAEPAGAASPGRRRAAWPASSASGPGSAAVAGRAHRAAGPSVRPELGVGREPQHAAGRRGPSRRSTWHRRSTLGSASTRR